MPTRERLARLIGHAPADCLDGEFGPNLGPDDIAGLLLGEVAHDLAERQRAHHAKQGIPCAGAGCPAVEVIDHIDPRKDPS